MAIFRRPELEKDNPIAPQPYIGPRRRLAMARAAALGESIEVGGMRDTLQTLIEAATGVVNSLPKNKKVDQRVKALREAITQAKHVLAVEGRTWSSQTEL